MVNGLLVSDHWQSKKASMTRQSNAIIQARAFAHCGFHNSSRLPGEGEVIGCRQTDVLPLLILARALKEPQEPEQFDERIILVVCWAHSDQVACLAGDSPANISRQFRTIRPRKKHSALNCVFWARSIHVCLVCLVCLFVCLMRLCGF